MADLNGLFAPSSALSPDILGELESMLRLYSISPQELFYKWESYSLKMGSEDTKLDLETVRMFKKDVQDGLERDTHGRHVGRGSERKSNVVATPRNTTTSGDVFGMQVCVIWSPLLVANVCLRLDELTPNTLPRLQTTGSSTKRKGEFVSPMPRKVSKPEAKSSVARQPAHTTEGPQ
jgi:DNA polymerase alpha subunit B